MLENVYIVHILDEDGWAVQYGVFPSWDIMSNHMRALLEPKYGHEWQEQYEVDTCPVLYE